MNNNAQKGWKPFVFKITIVVMSICYVFGPSHNEVNKLLHVLIHQLEMPDNVISHSTVSNSDYQVHETHTLKKSEEVHNHNILKLLDNILKASDSKQNQDNSKVLTLKTDKHLTNKNVYKYDQFTSPILVQHVFLFTEQKLQKGFGKDAIKPPQVA